MKAILVILLFALSLSEDKEGGWQFHEYDEKNDTLGINGAVTASFEEYKKSNPAVEDGYFVPVAVRTQVVSGTNYKIYFVDKKFDYSTIHEFFYYKPLAVNNEGKEEYKLQEYNQYKNDQGLLDYNKENFDLVEKGLYKLLKKKNIKLNYISYIIPIEKRPEDENEEKINFFIISAETDNGMNLYIVFQNPDTKEFYFCNEIN